MTDAQIAQAKRDWLLLRSEIRFHVMFGTPSRYIIIVHDRLIVPR